MKGRALAAAAWLAAGAASAQVARVAPGEDLSAGVLVGRVCEDLDGDGACGPRDRGVSGARLLLSDGTFAITDALGRYHLAGVPVRSARLLAGDPPGVREGYGRVLVKLDLDSLGRPAEVRGGPRRVVELGPASQQTVDFAVAFAAAGGSIAPGGPEAPPHGELGEGGLRYRLTGQVGPGHRVVAAGSPVELGADGRFAAIVPLQPGPNRVIVSDLAPGGELVFWEQAIAAVRREGGEVLFIPSPPRRAASLSLPPPEAATAGTVGVPIQADPGARVAVAGARYEVPAGGRVEGQLTLQAGETEVAVEVALPGGARAERSVSFRARPRDAASALVGVELSWDPRRRTVSALGRAAGAVQRSFGELELRGGVDLDTDDARALFGVLEDAGGRRVASPALTLLQPRAPLAVERALDPLRSPPSTGDDGVAGAFNPSGARLYLRARHPTYGGAEIGSFHAELGGAEVGRYERSLFGGELDAKVPLGPLTARARAFGAPPAAPSGELQPAPAHDELWGTGGSLFFLRGGSVVAGSEKLALEVRDGLTGLPRERRALAREVDYGIDYRSGRVLLAHPLPMADGQGPLLATPLQADRTVLVADYEVLSAAAPRTQVVGGQGRLEAFGASLAASAVRENRIADGVSDYRLLGASGRAKAGPFALTAEVARSEGLALPAGATGGFSISDTGGLSFLQTPAERASAPSARAYALRAEADEPGWGGALWARGREAGFSDSATGAASRARQVGGSGRATVGGLELSALADDRVGADPRDPLGSSTAAMRDALLRARVRRDALLVSAEASYALLDLPDQVGGSPQRGERVGLGARFDWAVAPELSLNASHHQRLAGFGSGLGARDDTFTAVGATLRPRDDLGLSARGGWGPGVGAEVQLGAERGGAEEIAYGTWTMDVDGPDAGRTAAVSGARRRVGAGTEAFGEDLFARDVDAIRMAKAVGLEVAPLERLHLQGRYERGLRLPFTGAPALLRDAGAARVSWIAPLVRASAAAEVRHERGDALAERGVDRWQSLAGVALEVRPVPALGLSGRLDTSLTRNRGALEQRLFEGALGASVRLEPVIVLAGYTVLQDIPVGTPAPAPRERLHLLSLRPSILVGERFRLGAGLAAAFERGDARSDAFSGSLRPAVRVAGPLEVAAEVARRSAAPDGESLDAARVELAWWYQAVAGIALGYNAYGFSGTGIGRDAKRGDRVYLRLEAAY